MNFLTKLRTFFHFKIFFKNVKEFFFLGINNLIFLKNHLVECYKVHTFVLKTDGIKIYLFFLKYNCSELIIILYVFYFLTRSCISLSMLPIELVDKAVVETNVEKLTNGVITHVVKTSNLEENIIGIPSRSLEEKLPHDINIFNMKKEIFSFNEIKVLTEKKNVSINELVDFRFRYGYVQNIYIGYNMNIEDSEIIENIKKINEQENIYNFFEKNFESNRTYYRNKFLFSVNKENYYKILQQCNLELNVKRDEFIKIVNENDILKNKIDSIINYILENKNKMNNIKNINENFFFKKFLLKEEVDLYKEENSIPKIQPIKVDFSNLTNYQIDDTGIVETHKYTDNVIKKINKLLTTIIKNIRK